MINWSIGSSSALKKLVRDKKICEKIHLNVQKEKEKM